jgi:hypothetical protein
MITNSQSLDNKHFISKKYNVQETIHLLPFPREITNNINSYLFYDKITGETRLHHCTK